MSVTIAPCGDGWVVERVAPRVPTVVRILTGALAVTSAWTAVWLIVYLDGVMPILRTRAEPVWFLVAWSTIAVMGAAGTVTGRDWPCRWAFAIGAITYASAVGTIAADNVPFVAQFYQVAATVLCAVTCAVLAGSSLRTTPLRDPGEVIDLLTSGITDA